MVWDCCLHLCHYHFWLFCDVVFTVFLFLHSILFHCLEKFIVLMSIEPPSNSAIKRQTLLFRSFPFRVGKFQWLEVMKVSWTAPQHVNILYLLILEIVNAFYLSIYHQAFFLYRSLFLTTVFSWLQSHNFHLFQFMFCFVRYVWGSFISSISEFYICIHEKLRGTNTEKGAIYKRFNIKKTVKIKA